MQMDSICMFFYQSSEVIFLFESLHVSNLGAYIACLLFTFFIGFCLEIVTVAVNYLKHSAMFDLHKVDFGLVPCESRDKEKKESLLKQGYFVDDSCTRVQKRLLISLAYFLQITLGYLLMMIVMTYNFLLLLVAILGMVSGYILIQCLQSRIKIEISDLDNVLDGEKR
ncbi:unnamed protein product [Moneuplotes crassus]|uniref:Copper transport protein n=1 Tax=Euplotes crassus TaxID=5936 RepID=A0AAD1Y0K1_EUPCR|nr:unnamed protein product [Moneuplotes crassus]